MANGGRRFIEGKGWLVNEGQGKQTPVNAKPMLHGQGSGMADSSVSVLGQVEGRSTPSILVLGQVNTNDLTAELETRGFMVIAVDDFNELTERNQELEKRLDNMANGEPVPELPQEQASKKKLTAKEIEEAISEVTDLDQLTVLMADVTSAKLLKLADAKAAELKGDA